MLLVFDTETTGLSDRMMPPDHPSQPHVVQIAAALYHPELRLERAAFSLLIAPDSWPQPYAGIPEAAVAVHGIDHITAQMFGVGAATACAMFSQFCKRATVAIAHNLEFDQKLIETAFARLQRPCPLDGMKKFCTMQAATPICKVPFKDGDAYRWKWPSLDECLERMLGETPRAGKHDAFDDLRICARVYFKLRELEAA